LDNKKWVFDLLVKDQNDTLGLLAYAIYKHRKSGVAKGMRQAGRKEEDIKQAMKNFHDMAVDGGDQLNDYKKEAVRLLDVLEQKLTEQMNKQHTKEITQKRNEIFKKIQHYSINEQSYGRRLWNWLIGEIPKAIASFILTIMLLGLAAWFAPESTKKIIIEGLLKTYVESIGVTTTPETKKAAH